MKVRVTPRYESSAVWDCSDFAIHESGVLALLNEEGKPFVAWGVGFWIDVQVAER